MYIQLLTTSGAATLADDAAFDLTNDAEWRFDFSVADYTPAAALFLAARYITTGANRNWRIRLDTDSDVLLDTEDGAGAFRITFDMLFTQPADGVRAQLRLTLDADDGAGNTVVTSYSRTGGAITDLTSDTGWTQDEVNGGNVGVQTWKATTNPIRLGASSETLTNGAVGMKFYRAIQWSDITKSTKVYDVTFDDASRVDADEWNDAARTGNWLLNGTENTDWSYQPDDRTATGSSTLGDITSAGAGSLNLAATGAATLAGVTPAGTGHVSNPGPPPSGERVIRHPTYTPRRR